MEKYEIWLNTGSIQLALTMVWNFDSLRKGSLKPTNINGHCKMLHHYLCHLITIWELGNLFALMTGCQELHNPMITICNFICWLPQKLIGKPAGKIANYCCWLRELPFISRDCWKSWKFQPCSWTPLKEFPSVQRSRSFTQPQRQAGAEIEAEIRESVQKDKESGWTLGEARWRPCTSISLLMDWNLSWISKGRIFSLWVEVSPTPLRFCPSNNLCNCLMTITSNAGISVVEWSSHMDST